MSHLNDVGMIIDLPQDFEYDDWEPLCEKLNALATDCNKHRAKTDKRKQRSVFRDVLKAVEVGLVVTLGV